ncbi:GAF domain-containing protein [Kocuria sp. U4B]
MSPAPCPGDSSPAPARLLLSAHDATTAVAQLTRTAHQIVPGATGAGLSLLDAHGTGISSAATGPAVQAADDVQYAQGVGPCLSAWATGAPQRIEDTTTETRWPGWSAAAAAAGIRSALSIPLVHQGQVLGALKVYAAAPSAFGAAEERLLGLLAQAVATLLAATPPVEAPAPRPAPVQQARATVEAATEVLRTREDLDPAAARAALLELARTQQRPLGEVATQVLETAVGVEQARRLGATMVAANITRAELWLHHYSIGGDVSELEVDAYLHHALTLPRLQRDLLAHAANEILDETAPPRAAYALDVLEDEVYFPADRGSPEQNVALQDCAVLDQVDPHHPEA